MLNTSKKDNLETPDEKKVRTFGIWHFALMAFIVMWMSGAYLYLDYKTNLNTSSPTPVIVLDSHGGINMDTFFRVNSNLIKGVTVEKPRFEVRDKYSYGDIVIIKYFYVEGVVIDKSLPSGDTYTVLYKDHNHVLQKIALPRTMLMVPSDGTVSPVSLLVD